MKYIKIGLIFFFLPGFLSAIVYENGESGGTANWKIYDNTPRGASIDNVYDISKNSNVIVFKGKGRKNSYIMGAKKGILSLSNTKEKIVKWSMKFSEKYRIVIYVDTVLGKRFFYYAQHNYDFGSYKTKYLRFGLGSQTVSGKWINVKRNLEEDLKKYEPKNKILKINAFKVQGSGRIDDIEFVSSNTQVKPLKYKTYEDAEDGKISRWFVSSKSGKVSNIYDNERKSRVIKLKGNGRKSSYLSGSRSSRSMKSWKNREKSIFSWSMKMNEKYRITLYTQTLKGARVFYISSKETNRGLFSKKYIGIGLGKKSINGKWQEFRLDLDKEIQKNEPNNKLISVSGVKIKGSGSFDDIKLLNNNTKEKSENNEFSKNRKLWNSKNIGNYSYNIELLSSIGPQPKVLVIVKNNKVVSVKEIPTGQKPSYGEFKSINKWFDTIKKLSASTSDNTKVTYDSLYGYPRKISFYPKNKMILGKGYTRIISNFKILRETPQPCTKIYAPVCASVSVQCFRAPCKSIEKTFANKCMMNNNRQAKFLYNGRCAHVTEQTKSDAIKFTKLWEKQAIKNYTFIYHVAIFAPRVSDQRITVKNGKIVSSVSVDTGKPLSMKYSKSIDDFFMLIKDHIKDSRKTITVKYNQEFGYPTTINTGLSDKRIMDAGATYTLRDLKILK